ncbi:MAG: hypothetical protein AB7I79_09610 [Rhizobiaceae bacterium]
MVRTALSAMTLLAALFALPASADTLTYGNARFGTTLSFPAELFDRRMEPPANGDGMTWVSTADGSSLAVFAFNNALEETPAGIIETMKTESGDSAVTYTQFGDDWAVISGITKQPGEPEQIFYQRLEFGADDVIHSFLLKYPPALRAVYDPLVAGIAGSLDGP